MAGYKETPRQKMIGMMYLVLTALLALNVSKEILSAFVVVNESLEVTNKNFEKKNLQSYDQFHKQMLVSPDKVGPYYRKAIQAQKYAEVMVEFINKERVELIKRVEGISTDEASKMTLSKVEAKDNYDIPTRMFIGESQNGSAGDAKILKDKIEEFKKNMLNLLDPQYRDKVKLGLVTDGKYEDAEGASENWEMHNFYHIVTAATVVTLNKMIMEVRNAEFDIVAQLYSSVSAEDFKFDKIGAKVVPKSSYVIVGDSYEADIFVAAYDTKQKPIVMVGGDVDTVTNTIIGGSGDPVEVSEGVGKYKVGASGVGEKKYGGVITVPTPSGGVKSYWFKGVYNVASPTATVSAEATKVFYIGLDNPVSISVPGVASENVTATITGGITLGKPDAAMTKTFPGSNYVVKNIPAGVKLCTLTVSAKVGGASKSMGVFPFKIKQVPAPIPSVSGKRSGTISKAQLSASPYVTAEMDNFLFEGVNFKVTGFTFSASIGGLLQEANCVGMTLDSKAQQILAKAKSGSKVFFENIKATGPGGSRSLPAVILKIQ